MHLDKLIFHFVLTLSSVLVAVAVHPTMRTEGIGQG